MEQENTSVEVGVVMGSRSDWDTMRNCAEILEQFGVAYECRVVSAHRTPEWMVKYAKEAADRGLKCIVAGAGGAAHLAGVIAALTPLPVLGVPMEGKVMGGLDAILSMVQMPAGIPVGTLAVGRSGAVNAAILMIQLVAGEHLANVLNVLIGPHALREWRVVIVVHHADRYHQTLAQTHEALRYAQNL